MSKSDDLQELSAVVLAGGKSSRLGRDKTRVCLQGQTLVQRMVGLSREFCPDTHVVGQRVDPELGTSWMLDKIPGIGPMGGIITALESLQRPCLVLACDLPCLKPGILSRLIQHWSQSGRQKCMTTYRQEGTGYIEALVAIYEPSCLELLLASYQQGCYKLTRAIPEQFRLHIPYGPEEKPCFFNINYPYELEKVLSGTNPDLETK